MKKNLLRIFAFCFALLLCVSCLTACTGKGETLMSLKKDGVRVTLSQNTYELMLSRIKGNLYLGGYTANGYTADYDAFWSYNQKYNNEIKTLDEHYREIILDNCRTYLVGLYLFEKEGLSLSATELEQIDDMMYELLRTDGNGSKTKLNAVLSEYSMNYDMLKEVYTIEAKVAAIQTHLYGKNAELISDTIKTEYMEENYVHFRQIFLPAYRYKYESDKNGDTVYYYDEEGKENRIYYDVHNGVKGQDDAGEDIKDENGDTVYFVNDGSFTKIAYDSINGTPARIPTEDGSSYETENLNQEELTALEKRAQTILSSLVNTSESEFEQIMEKETEDAAEISEYDDGYYLQKGIDYAASGADYAYLADIVSKLDTMEIGEMSIVQSDYGYHIIRKYAHSQKAYENEVNEAWFENFNSDLIDYLFLETCKKHYDAIQLDEKVYAKTPSMKEIGINLYY